MAAQTVSIPNVTNKLPGIIIISAIGYLAYLISTYNPLLDALVVGLVLGILLRLTIGNQEILNPGITLTQTVFIQLGLILYGVKLNFTRIFAMGWLIPILIVAVQATIFLVTLWAGKRFKVDEKTTLLLAVGTSICGASAIAVVTPAVEGESKDVSISLVVITLLGTSGAIIYSLIAPIINPPVTAYAFFAASTLHMTGLVKVAASVIEGATDIALAIKLFRTAMLAPVILILGFLQSRRNAQEFGQRTPFPIPWFVIAFITMAIIITLGLIPTETVKTITLAGKIIFTIALAAIGYQVNVLAFWNAGLRPLWVGSLGWLTAIGIGLLGFFILSAS